MSFCIDVDLKRAGDIHYGEGELIVFVMQQLIAKNFFIKVAKK